MPPTTYHLLRGNQKQPLTQPFFKDKNSGSAADNDFNDIHSDRFRRVSAAYEKCCAYFKEAGVQWGKIVDQQKNPRSERYWCDAEIDWKLKILPLCRKSMVFSYSW